MMDDLTCPPTEVEIAEVLSAIKYHTNSTDMVTNVIRRLAFERDRLRDGLKEIAKHSVCCDARHAADRILVGKPANEDDTC